jgi:hypothetical protein
VIALDGVAYSKIEGISFSSYPGTQSEQGALPIATRLTGSITGDVLTVTAGPYDGKIVAGMTLSYALFGVGQSPVGLTILAFGTGGTTGTGLTGTYKLSSTPGLTDPDMTATSVVPRMTGIMAYQSSILGTTSAIHFENLNISNMYAGIAAVQGLGNVENCILLNVAFATCGLRGLWLTNQNVLNWQVYGGGCSNSGWLSTFDNASGTGDPGGAYYAGTGSIGCIYGVSTTGNNWDIIAGQQCHVAGGSSEGGPAIPLYGGTITWSSAAGGTARWTGNLPHKMQMDQPIAILQCSVAGYNGRFTGHRVDAYTFTYPLAVNPVATGTDGYIVPTNSGTVLCVGNTMSIDGFAFRGGSSLYILPIYCAGYAVMKGCSFNCGNDGGQGIIAWLSNGYLDLNGTNIITYDSSTFKAVGNSELRMRGTNWIGRPANPFVLFAGGVVSEYDQIQRTTVANLPTASSIFTGLRGSVTDLNIARAYGGSVVGHGGGSTFCDVVCTGSDWIMA